METEIEKIKRRYERRPVTAKKLPAFSAFHHYMLAEREYWYGHFLTQHFESLANRTILEVGAGGGTNLLFMLRLGFQTKNIYANELIPSAVQVIRDKNILPPRNILEGSATDLPIDQKYDVVFQSTVFTSILDEKFQEQLAQHMWNLLKPGGLILWYDFVYNNPSNKDVRGITKRRVKALFPESKSSNFVRVTLAPPIGRRVGRLYPYFNLPFLRSHIVATFEKWAR